MSRLFHGRSPPQLLTAAAHGCLESSPARRLRRSSPSSSVQHAHVALLDTSRPVHLGFPHQLRPGTSPHAFRIPPHGGHPALRRTASGGSRSVLAVSGFRLRARLDLSIPSPSSVIS